MKSPAIVAFLLLSSPAFSARDDAKAGGKQLEGTWKPLSAEIAGKPYPEKVLKAMKLVLNDDKYTVEIVGEQTDEGTFSVDPEKSPKEMDIKGIKGPNKGKTILAIYELNGEELRICYDLSGKARPTEFATKKATKLFLVTYAHPKP